MCANTNIMQAIKHKIHTNNDSINHIIIVRLRLLAWGWLTACPMVADAACTFPMSWSSIWTLDSWQCKTGSACSACGHHDGCWVAINFANDCLTISPAMATVWHMHSNRVVPWVEPPSTLFMGTCSKVYIYSTTSLHNCITLHTFHHTICMHVNTVTNTCV